MELGKVKLRKCVKEDAEQISNFFNKFEYGPVTHGCLLKESDVQRLFIHSKIVLFLCLEYEDKIIGTMLFSTHCGQKAADTDAVWGSNFLIHPQFRNGPLPGMFFSNSIKQLTELGYKYIDVDVDPTNSAALPLYKRVGFIRREKSILDYDGYLELRCYLPLVTQFLKQSYNVTTLNDSLVESGWKSLISASNIRSTSNDTYALHGMETYQYEMKFDNESFSCWVDMLSEKVAMMEDPRFRFISYIEEGQELNQGQTVTAIFEFENRLDQRMLVSFNSKIGERALSYRNGKKSRLLAPGEKISWKEYIIIPHHILEFSSLRSTVKFGDYKFSFHYGYNATRPLAVSVAENTSLLTNQPTKIKLNLVNHTSKQFKGLIEIRAVDSTRIKLDKSGIKELVIPARDSIQYPVHLKCLGTGIDLIEVILYNNNHDRVHTKVLELPIISRFSSVRFKDGIGNIILENSKISVKLEESTGGLSITERIAGNQVVREAWPDLGLPFIGTVKRMPKRKIIILEPNEENTLIAIELKDDKVHLIRKITLGGNSMIGIEDYAIGKGEVLKITPWCSIKDSIINIPFVSGIVRDTLIFEDFPFLTNDFEYMRDQDLPSDPKAYFKPWTLFENKEIKVKMTWEGEVNSVMYGMRWMPSVIFNRCSSIRDYRKINKKNWDKQYLFLGENNYLKNFNKNKTIKSIEGIIADNIPDASHYFNIDLTRDIDEQSIWNLVGVQQENSGRANISLILPDAVSNIDTLKLKGKVKVVHLSELCGKLELNIPALNFNKSQSVGAIHSTHPLEFSFLIDVKTDKKIINGTITFENMEKGIYAKKNFQLDVIENGSIVTIEKKEKRSISVYSVNNGFLEFEVSPDLQGSLISLKYGPKNLLSSHFPRFKNWGQNTATPGGIYPHLIEHEIDIEKGYLFEDRYIETFISELVKGGSSIKDSWEGISCRGQDYVVNYLTRPGSPKLKLEILYTDLIKANQIFNIALHSFWNKLGRKRQVYFWNILGENILRECGIRRRVYTSDTKAILDVGKDFYLTLWGESEDLQLVISEWPDQGFQLSFIQSLKNRSVKKDVGKFSIYICISRTLEEAKSHINIS
ncbi:hypothetical protein F0342_21045 [Bacillus sp. CH30_1T]|uniref:GNAT family N-acetyltransferase n=1 Tax=Bacillus sp. CH30_1T TaxID=2604836 RepID=UPI0011EC7962|nr:GNAT family N-acetyltransferase [Bacillus sp. CH30_1T]KAA0560849.1 hypothetical protein F0342_21045 [Bacillus sp. CH30_1T]